MQTQQDQIKTVFNTLNANNMSILDDFYASDTLFIDPLGRHEGLESVKGYYKNLYQNVSDIHFEFTDFVSSENKHTAIWTMSLKAKGLNSGETVTLHGNSVIYFNAENKVRYHRDYFDMGEFIYEHIPLLSRAILYIKRRLKK